MLHAAFRSFASPGNLPDTAPPWVFFIESSIMASLYFQREMEALNPKSPEELKEEQEEREFLNGGQEEELIAGKLGPVRWPSP
jgi:hypothetical protein